MGLSNKFIFGVATSSYQIEGGIKEGGRTPSIWDTYCDIPGRVLNGDTGEIACDHYHKYKEDIALMKEIGIESYRFSISWSRIYPEQGVYNPEGMEFYKNIIKELQKNNMTAMVTLYHWDMPQWAFEQGGWLNRDSVAWFEEYSEKCFSELDQDVEFWVTHNEPYCASFVSYLEGRHAPGHKDLEEAIIASHHILLSHGGAVRLYREMGCKNKIGITLNLTPAYPTTNTYADMVAANNRNGYTNRWFLDAVFKGCYPIDMINLYAAQCRTDFAYIHEGDMEIIATKSDFLGVNFYSRTSVDYDPTSIQLAKNAYYSSYKQTAMGWDIAKDEFVDLIQLIRKDYTTLPIYITENGSAWNDVVVDGKVHDTDRVEYLLLHLNTIEKMNVMGLDIAGYYYWSFMDNFEWAWGYTKRFGLVYINYETQERIPKDSFYSYKKYISEKMGTSVQG